MLNRMKIACIFAGGAVAGLMVAICTCVLMNRSGSVGGEVLILPLIGLLLYVGYEFGYLSAMTEVARRRRSRTQKGGVRNG